MDNSKYYGCENPESVSYLEFGSINLVKGEKSIWNYWQDQMAYDLYMFARYSKDLFAFRKFFEEKEKSVEKLNEYVLKAAHNKLMDYIFKYAGMIALKNEWGGVVCENGSSLYGWIDEAIACDYVFNKGENVDKIKGFEYIGSDISDLMNEGAASFHSDVKMIFTTEDTIDGVISEIKDKFQKKLSIFYGVSVSVRYTVRNALDLVKAADMTELSMYNRLSVTFDNETLVSVYGTGKSVYIVSLPRLIEGLKEKGISAKYCTANMQYGKDGERTVRASIIISRDEKLLSRFIEIYNDCIEKSIHIQGVERGEWRDLEELLLCEK